MEMATSLCVVADNNTAQSDHAVSLRISLCGQAESACSAGVVLPHRPLTTPLQTSTTNVTYIMLCM